MVPNYTFVILINTYTQYIYMYILINNFYLYMYSQHPYNNRLIIKLYFIKQLIESKIVNKSKYVWYYIILKRIIPNLFKF